MKKLFFIFLFILAFITQAITQNVWENNNSEVHPFLYRMAQKGFIEYNDLIKPINRVNVLNVFNILKLKPCYIIVAGFFYFCNYENK